MQLVALEGMTQISKINPLPAILLIRKLAECQIYDNISTRPMQGDGEMGHLY